MTTATPDVNPMASVFAAFAEQYEIVAAQANKLADQLNHAGNTTKLVHEVRDDKETTDETILKYREWYSQVNEAILKNQAAVEAHIVSAGLIDTTPVDVPTATTQYKELKTQANAMKGAIKVFPGHEDVLDKLTALQPVSGVRVGTGGGGTGIRRPRLASITVDGDEVFTTVKAKDGSDKKVANFTNTAIHLGKINNVKVDSEAIRSAAFAAAGTEDLATLNGKPISFNFSVGDNNYAIVATPSVAS